MPLARKKVFVVTAVFVVALLGVTAVVVRNQAVITDPNSKKSTTTSTKTDGINARVVSSQEQLDQLALKGETATIPKVDFSSQSLAIFTYAAPTPGYQLDISPANSQKFDITIHTPGSGCVRPQVITTIYGFAVVEKDVTSPGIGTVVEQKGADCPV